MKLESIPVQVAGPASGMPGAILMEIAELLELTPADVQDTLSFYGFFKQDQPHGRKRIWICRSISCELRGSNEMLDHLRDRLGIEPGESTEDGSVTLEIAECLGACEHAPCMLAGDAMHPCLTKEKLDEYLDSLK